eukprot:scaffold4992_cov33-Tisochrysis_lutea.AAC.2
MPCACKSRVILGFGRDATGSRSSGNGSKLLGCSAPPRESISSWRKSTCSLGRPSSPPSSAGVTPIASARSSSAATIFLVGTVASAGASRAAAWSVPRSERS